MIPIVAVLVCWIAAVIGYFIGDPAIWIPYAFINPAIFFIPRLVYEFVPRVRKRLTVDWRDNMERVGLGILLLNIPGSLYLHELGVQYDRFLHLTAAFLGFFVAFLILSPIFTKLPAKSDKIKALSIASFVTFIGLFAWEGVQFTSDKLFGTHLFFDVAQPIQRDFTEDILFGFAGLLIALLLFRHSRRVWRRYAEKSFK